MKNFILKMLILISTISLFVGCSDNNKVKNDYSVAVTDYFDVYLCGKTEKIEKLAPKVVIEYLIKNKNFSIENRKNIIDSDYINYRKSIESIYGKNATISVKVNSKELINSDLESYIKKCMTNWYGIINEDIKEISTAKSTIIFSGNGKEKTQDVKCLVVQINDEWFVCNQYADFGISNSQIYY